MIKHMKNTTPEQFIEQLENQTPAMVFVQQVNECFPGTFQTDEEMREQHIMGDIDTFDKTEGEIPS